MRVKVRLHSSGEEITHKTVFLYLGIQLVNFIEWDTDGNTDVFHTAPESRLQKGDKTLERCALHLQGNCRT